MRVFVLQGGPLRLFIKWRRKGGHLVSFKFIYPSSAAKDLNIQFAREGEWFTEHLGLLVRNPYVWQKCGIRQDSQLAANTIVQLAGSSRYFPDQRLTI